MVEMRAICLKGQSRVSVATSVQRLLPRCDATSAVPGVEAGKQDGSLQRAIGASCMQIDKSDPMSPIEPRIIAISREHIGHGLSCQILIGAGFAAAREARSTISVIGRLPILSRAS